MKPMCVICGSQKTATEDRAPPMPFSLEELGLNGTHAHASCIVRKRSSGEKLRPRLGPSNKKINNRLAGYNK